MTRSKTKQVRIHNFEECIVRIKRNGHLEKLYSNRRTAKIAARRKTFTFDNVTAQTTTAQNALFKKISAKPFTRRTSVNGLQSLQSVSTKNNASADVIANDSNRELEASAKRADENSDANQNITLASSTSNSASNVSFEDNDAIDDDKENCNENEILPFLPLVNSCKDAMRSSSPILDVAVPSSLNLARPLNPLIDYSTSLLDCAIPSNGIDLPLPIIPLAVHQANVVCAVSSFF